MTDGFDRPEYAAVRHILTSPLIAEGTAPFLGDGAFDWEGLFAEPQAMAGGGLVLLRIAYDLWHAEGVVGIWELPRRLDRSNYERVLEALTIYRGEPAGATDALRDAA